MTLLSVREAIRQRYDLPTFTDAPPTFVSLTAVNAAINSSLQAYYALLIACYGDAYYETVATLTTVPLAITTPLPLRLYKLTTLLWSRGTDDVIKLHPVSHDDQALGLYAAQAWLSGYTPRYRLQGQTLRWYPPPTDVCTLQCVHSALPPDLAVDADTFEAGPGHEDWVVLDVCRKIATREEKSTEAWLMERADVEQRIRAQAAERDEGEPGRIRDGTGGAPSAYELRNLMTDRV
jgi:hypothetical protein